MPYWLALGNPCASPGPGDASSMVQNEPGDFPTNSRLLGAAGWDFVGQRQLNSPQGHRAGPGSNGQGAELLGTGVTRVTAH